MVKTASIIASGTSLDDFKGSFIGQRVFINHTWKYFNWSDDDMLICMDKINHRVDANCNRWPAYETQKKNGGRWEPRGREFQTEDSIVANFNTSVAFAINVLWHLGYRKLYMYGVDGRIGEDGRMHFYDKESMSAGDIKRWNTVLSAMNIKILKCVHGFEENGGEVVFFDSMIYD